jgi:NAD(P)-dependent dehydrogenase (short-subunit alcohol dehydrogenase family)
LAERHERHIPDDKWDFTFGVNVKGSYIVGDEAFKTWKEQGLRGALVLTTSANAAVAKKAALLTTPARRRRITWCASWQSSLLRWCA